MAAPRSSASSSTDLTIEAGAMAGQTSNAAISTALRMGQLHLHHIGMAHREGGRADLEIIFPVSKERLAMTHFGDPPLLGAQALGPAPAGPRVILAKGETVAQLQPRISSLARDHLVRQPHAAGKHVLADIIRRRRIALIERIAYGDRLQYHPATFGQVLLEHREIAWPITRTDRLDHLDRDDIVILPRHVAIIPQLDIGAPVQAALGIGMLVA